ncbi:MAG: MBL fold metallo-hydrolase [Clostridia bacterium]|nr:MBL fold metallo-hydrolase [Clostridia bacterium]
MKHSRTSRLRVNVVVDNWVAKRNFRGEHGLAFYIEKDGKSFLFDTGQSVEILAHNAAALGIDFGRVEGVFLSHGHYDHTGGLPAVAGGRQGLPVYFHPKAWQEKYAAGEGEPRYIGLPWQREELEEKGVVFFTSPKPAEPGQGLMLSGEIPFSTDFAGRPQGFLIKQKEGFCDDEIRDEQALFIEGPQGLVVVLGCGHRGVVNTLRQAVKLTGEKVQAVIGGMHLGESSPEIVAATAGYLLETGVALVAPLHCTGQDAVFTLRGILGQRLKPAGAGTVFEF